MGQDRIVINNVDKNKEDNHMKIKSITIEGMHNVSEKTYTFDNLSYLYGHNGAGKSTALQAIQLALLGYIPGVDKKNEAIFKHAKNKTLVVTCKLDSDGKEISVSRSFVGTGKTVTKAVDITPEGMSLDDILSDIELPIYNFSDFLQLSANKMKEWFINFLPNAEGDLDWNKMLLEALDDKKVIDETLVPSTLDHIKEISSTGINLVKDVNAYFKEQVSFMKGNLDRANATIQSLVFYDDCEEGADVESIKAEISRLNDYLIKSAKIESVREMNKRINEQIASIQVAGTCIEDDPDYSEIQKAIKDTNEMIIKFEADMKDIVDKKSEIDSKVAELNADIKSKTAITSGKGVCPYTKAECTSIKELISELDEEIRQDIAQINEHSKKLAELANSYTNSSLALQSAKATLQSKMNEASAITHKYKELSRLKSQIQMEELIEGQEMTSEEVRKKIEEMQTTLTKVAANQKYNELMESLTADKYKTENSIEVLKIWAKLTDANGLQTTLAEKPFQDLAESMTSYLHKMFGKKDITAKFFLSDKANSFSFGIEREGKYIAYDLLSSGEKCMYTLALMMCLISESKSPLKVIMIDDLLDHLDDSNATKVFDALYKVKGIQVILAGVKECNCANKDDIVIEIK